MRDYYGLVFLTLLGCAWVASAIHLPGKFVDPRDGQRYPSVKIGKQLWMARNLAYAAPGSSCGGDDSGDCERNGRLYTWSLARHVCPKGWHLPSDSEWMILETQLGMSQEQVRSRGARGTDQGVQVREGGSSGFNAPISGYRRPDGSYARRGERAAFWASTEANEDDAWHRDIRSDVGTIYRSEVTKTYALSVRCLSDREAR